MTQTATLKKLQRAHWTALSRLFKVAYREGWDAGIARAHGQGRRRRTIRADATVDGLVRRIEDHFGLGRYGFEVRVVHAASGRRVGGRDLLRSYLVEEKA
jgi:hypothetical protein